MGTDTQTAKMLAALNQILEELRKLRAVAERIEAAQK